MGLVSVFSVDAAVLVLKKKLYTNNYLLLLTIWALLGWLLVYLPVNFNRRLANGWHIALTITTMFFLFWWYKENKYIRHASIIAIFSFLLLFDSFTYINTASLRINENYENKFFYTRQTKEIYQFIKSETKKDSIILTRGLDGNVLPAFTGQTVYVGHSIQTWKAADKNKEVIELWTSQEDISTWLGSNGIDYIFASREYIPEFYDIKWLATEDYIEVIVDNDNFIFYEVKK